ncbi:MAG: RNA polymerase sporulation sigma factor SigK [Ruminococcus sp.]|nr:RNA polymerase sporulation sigma factor SigK [Ruminococcus sp.]
MFELIYRFLCENLLYFALHFDGRSVFPKPLSAAEERECFERMEKGDKAAKDKLISHNLRLVAHIIKKYYSTSSEQDDLISIGTVGLIKGVTTFNYKKGTRFATYASKCVENEILMHFRAGRKCANDIHISDPIDTDKDGNSLTLMDMLADDENIDETVELRISSQQLYRYIDEALSGREREIIILRYGLSGSAPLTQREVAKRLDISRSYVSRIEKKALELLKEKYEENA